MQFDQIDRAILNALQLKADSTVAEISEQVGLSHTPCWRRLKKLEETGVILARTAILNPEMVGFSVTVFAQVSVRINNEKTLSEFEAAVQDIDEVLECYSISGDKDFMLRIVAQSVNSYEALLKKRLIHLPGVSAIDSIITLSPVKTTTRLPLEKIDTGKPS